MRHNVQARVVCRTAVRFWLLAILFLTAPAQSPTLQGSDAYYQTFLPQLPPTTPAPVNQPGLFSRISKMHSGRTGRVQKMVIMADEPRQAAMAAIENPCLGVTLANHALSAGMDAERQQLVTAVDLYFEAVAFSWNFLQSPGAPQRPEYQTAWQIYHHSLARLLATGQRFGRLDPSRGLRVVTPVGPQTIATTYTGFVWKSTDFTRIEVVASKEPRKLRNHYSCPGLGVPLVVVRAQREPERFLLDEIPFGATAVLRPSLAALAGTAPPVGAPSSHGPLELYDPLRVACVNFGEQRIAMATDTSAALEYGIRSNTYSPLQGLIRPGSTEAGLEKLFLIEPYQPGKYPIVFVHGFVSSPIIWAEFANEILARPDLRECLQLAAYRYPTGRPFPESSSILRQELYALKEKYDPHGEDPGIANTALVGHSMGGLVSKLTITHSDDRLWQSVSNRPLTELNVSDASRKRLHEFFYFEPVPFVRRVVFMGTPHDGAMLAGAAIGRLASRRVEQPAEERIAHDLLVKQNPGVFTKELTDGVPTSIELMRTNSGLLKAIQTLCPGENVQLHNVIGVGLFSPLSGIGDGIVSAHSAQHPWVTTEKRVHTNHVKLHSNKHATQEFLCLLRRHILEANDVPSVDGYEFAVPESEVPYAEFPCPEFAPSEECDSEIIFSDPPNLDLWPDLTCPELSDPDPCESLELQLPTLHPGSDLEIGVPETRGPEASVLVPNSRSHDARNEDAATHAVERIIPNANSSIVPLPDLPTVDPGWEGPEILAPADF